jgi:hypothetical protein
MDKLDLDPADHTEPNTWEEMRSLVIENSIQLPNHASAEARRAEMRSQSMHLLRAFVDEGIRVAKERGLEPMTPGAWRAIEAISDIAKDVILSLSMFELPFDSDERAKLSPEKINRTLRITHPTPARDLVYEARRGKQGVIDKDGFHDAVSRYLQSEFRFPFADRILLTASIDIETVAYLAEIYEKNILTRKSVASVMDRAPIATWLIGRGWSVLRLAVVTVALIGMTRMDWLSEVNAFWLFLGFAGLWALGTVVSIMGYLSFRQRWKSLQPKLVHLPQAMVAFYGELHSEGPLSVRRVREQSQKLADMGAVWPGGVWALLDDMEARGVVTMHG